MPDKLPISIHGTVRPYKGNGRKLGYPTANIGASTNLRDGVYFGFANLDKYEHCPALIFIGTPTTIGDTGRRVEAYLLGIPDVDYYGQKLLLEIRHFHRPNQKFGSISALLAAIRDDEMAGRAWFDQSK